MSLLASFLDPRRPSLKICGVTRAADAEELAALGVDALGANFWPKSKRFLDPAKADFLKPLAGKILRVGVFVNADFEETKALYEKGFIDAVQLHGDETIDDARPYVEAGIPFIKAIGVRGLADLTQATAFGARALLLDAHAPGVYGGTGEVIDWTLARLYALKNHSLPVILAGGITPTNAAQALRAVRPAAIDIASGAEIEPGVKDFHKVRELLKACREVDDGTDP
jgi:phosphoribosylanthranilate isomerase